LRNKQIEHEIELEAVGLEVGESIGGLECPFCGGGRTGEQKFGITRTDTGLLYNCYRASCTDGRGFIPTRGDLLAGPKPRAARKKWSGPYRGEFRPLKSKDYEYFADRFDLSPAYVGFAGVNESNHYVLEIKTMDGYVRGYVVRRGCWSGDKPRCPRTASIGGPKSRAYSNNPDDVMLSWHKPIDDGRWATERRIVVVEDQISAAKVAQAGQVGVALTGSYLGEDKVKEIASWLPSEVTIALDADATGEAYKFARKWGLAFRKTRVLQLTKDIKDLKRDDVEELLL
jgi:hypothetical protein